MNLLDTKERQRLSSGRHMPIGSGAIQSDVRRVINLRVKSNAVYWLSEVVRFSDEESRTAEALFPAGPGEWNRRAIGDDLQ